MIGKDIKQNGVGRCGVFVCAETCVGGGPHGIE